MTFMATFNACFHGLNSIEFDKYYMRSIALNLCYIWLIWHLRIRWIFRELLAKMWERFRLIGPTTLTFQFFYDININQIWKILYSFDSSESLLHFTNLTFSDQVNISRVIGENVRAPRKGSSTTDGPKRPTADLADDAADATDACLSRRLISID